MDNYVQVSDDIYINLAETVKVEKKGELYTIFVREGDGSLTAHYCGPRDLGYTKLLKLLKKAQ